MNDKPYLRFMLLAQKATFNEDGTANLFGIFKGCGVASLSEEMPRADIRLIVAVGLYELDAAQAYTVTLKIEAPDGYEEEIGELPFGQTEHGYLDTQYAPLLMYVSVAGAHRLKCYLGNRLLGSYPFEIRHERSAPYH